MEREEWKKVLENWLSSRKYAELRKSLKKSKMKNMTEEQVLELVREIFEYSLLTDEEKECTDWIDQEFIDMSSKRVVLEGLVTTVSQWSVFQVHFEHLERFELCGYIQEVISIEVTEAKRLIKTYFVEEDTDDSLLEEICINCREIAYKAFK